MNHERERTDLEHSLLLYLEQIWELAERPLYRSLEVGFRHTPLSKREIEVRKDEALEEIAAIARHALGWKRIDE